MPLDLSRGDVPLLQAEGLAVCYRSRRRRCGSGDPPWQRTVQALAGVDLTIRRGAALAVVGESGSGKSTLARCLTLFEQPDSGSLRYDGEDALQAGRERQKILRRRLQLVFQDPATALNPRFTSAQIVDEPLRIAGDASRDERRVSVHAAMEQVGLLAGWADRRPAELSGGQRQRLAIARALVLDPELLVLDEALAALDLSVQSQIVNLVRDLRAERSLATVVISHDLRMTPFLADHVVVMQRGEIVEQGPVGPVFEKPKHHHTRALIAATGEIHNS